MYIYYNRFIYVLHILLIYIHVFKNVLEIISLKYNKK